MSELGTTAPKSVFLVEGQAIYRMGLKQFLSREPDLVIQSESGVLRGTAHRILSSEPDLVIMDLSMPDGNGLELIKEIRMAAHDGYILVLTSQDEALYAERALRAGANGYLMKSEDPDQILEAIQSVLRGEIFVSVRMNARLLRKMTGSRSNQEHGSIDRLTDRELQVLELIGAGLKTGHIAERLSISSKTVDTHRINIRQKLGIPDVNELIRFAVHWLGSGEGQSS